MRKTDSASKREPELEENVEIPKLGKQSGSKAKSKGSGQSKLQKGRDQTSKDKGRSQVGKRSKNGQSLSNGSKSCERSSKRIIDCIPTAMDYHSDDSVGEWLEQKSAASRYTSGGLLLEDDEEREDPEAQDHDLDFGNEMGNEEGDRYSLNNVAKGENTGIERLWSDDSHESAIQTRLNQIKVVKPHLPGSIVSDKGKQVDPIYESPKKRMDALGRKPLNPKRRQGSAMQTDITKPHKRRSSSRSSKGLSKASSHRSSNMTKHSKSRQSRSRSRSRSRSTSASPKKRSSSITKKDISPVIQNPDLPTPMSESVTSSLTDPLQSMLNYTVTDQIVKEIEQKLKMLKKQAADAKASVERAHRKRGGKKLKSYSGVLIPVETSKGFKDDSTPRDAVEMMRSGSSSTEQKESCTATSKERTEKSHEVLISELEHEDEACMQQNDNRSFSRLFSKAKFSAGSSKGSCNDYSSVKGNYKKSKDTQEAKSALMHTNALFEDTDSIDVATLSQPGQATTPHSYQSDAKEPLKETHEADGHNVEENVKERIDLKRTRSWKLNWLTKEISRKSRSATKMAQSWKKLGMMKRRTLGPLASNTKTTLEEKPSGKLKAAYNSRDDKIMVISAQSNSMKKDPDVVQRIKPIVTNFKRNALTELDEYSTVIGGVSNKPGIVQCLNFYACGTIATNVDGAIKVLSCDGANHPEEGEDEENTARDTPSTPQPAVEVELKLKFDDVLQLKNDIQGQDILSQNDSILHGSKHSRQSHITRRSILSCGEAGITSSFDEGGIIDSSSFVVEVTDKQLHLDGDSLLDRQLSMDDDSRHLKLSFASISLPSKEDYVKKPKRNKSKRKDIIFKRTDTTDEVSEREEHVAMWQNSEGLEMPVEKVRSKKTQKGRLQKLVTRLHRK